MEQQLPCESHPNRRGVTRRGCRASLGVNSKIGEFIKMPIFPVREFLSHDKCIISLTLSEFTSKIIEQMPNSSLTVPFMTCANVKRQKNKFTQGRKWGLVRTSSCLTVTVKDDRGNEMGAILLTAFQISKSRCLFPPD